jgi:hypothetical protein
MRTTVTYQTDAEPHCAVEICKVADGVWYVWCDFYERYELEGLGGDTENGCVELYFGDGTNILITVTFWPPDGGGGYIFGDMMKTAYHGTYYAYDEYCKIVEGGSVCTTT